MIHRRSCCCEAPLPPTLVPQVEDKGGEGQDEEDVGDGESREDYYALSHDEAIQRRERGVEQRGSSKRRVDRHVCVVRDAER